MLTGIRWLHEQGQTLVEMESWGDKLEVLKMYRELGFKDIRQLVCYQIDLPKGDKTDLTGFSIINESRVRHYRLSLKGGEEEKSPYS